MAKKSDETTKVVDETTKEEAVVTEVEAVVQEPETKKAKAKRIVIKVLKGAALIAIGAGAMLGITMAAKKNDNEEEYDIPEAEADDQVDETTED